MPALPDGSYHPHRVRLRLLTDRIVQLVVEAVPPDGEPFDVMSCGIEPTPDIVAAVNDRIRDRGIEVETLGIESELLGPGMPISVMILVGTTREVDRG